MNKQDETNLLLREIKESLLKGEVVDYMQVVSAILIDMDKALSIIVDNIQNLGGDNL